ncbi:MAG: Rrf2 family transcriptional regulator [Ruminococcus sp.]|nr:Rrf2 family transcriptional regulator [Ruminococcus sp.]
MKISTKGRYALRMVTDLAMYQNNEYVSLKDIAERQNISKKYLEQIVPMLNKSGILKTNRGNRGGYMLNRNPSELTVSDILIATEGSLAPVSCLENEVNDCPRKKECSTIHVWEGLYKTVYDYLSGITIQDIIDKYSPNDGDYYCI